MTILARAPLALGLIGLSSLSFASTVDLGRDVVTATRTSHASNIAATTVFERTDIERLQVNTAEELLRRATGVNLINNGGPGKSTSLQIRGSSDKHVLVMIDGVRVGSATSGVAALQNLPVEQIERIEIVRGPRSSLYGSEALGGVVQIFTRKGGDGLTPYFSTTVGSRQHRAGTAGVSGGDDNAWFNLGISSLDTEGYDARPSREKDHDGYRELSASLSGGYRFANGLLLDANLLQVESHNDYDSGNKANADSVLRAYGARARFAPSSFWDVTLQVGRSEDKNENYKGSIFDTRYDTRRDSASWQNDLALSANQLLTVGYDWQQDSISSSVDYPEDSRYNHGLFAQYLLQAGRHEWQLGLRHDDNEAYGEHTTGSVGYGYALTDSISLTTSYGTAFRAPTFNELYYPGYGNPAIEAETSRNLEVGLRGQHRWGSWSANAFRNDIDDMIASVRVGGVSMAENVDKARITGLELEVLTQQLGWSWQANLTLQDPENRSSSADDDLLLRRVPEQIFNLDVDRRFGRIGLGASVHAEGRRWDNATNTSDLHGYNTVELRAEYWLSDAWRVQARVSNLFDNEYETAATYTQPGRAGYLTLRYQPL
ncbi:TonB-dependent receptor [Halopseudomonas oceani]|uniref:TonB-dependent vitamin B12 receptor n=1 Tax=Halopseudomonas oceani TaxID=1708783 RepID=A0A2P4EUD8_9GAMM|nr:TonB-dependent vitamin B12 receptor [Halopseudomonas oceani]POB03051.1 TonB-dependent vitamin B12 receptor [Halopseudomonas oceani]GGE50853.1 TonB-dependent receptor [Halopseudomonas oceani]